MTSINSDYFLPPYLKPSEKPTDISGVNQSSCKPRMPVSMKRKNSISTKQIKLLIRSSLQRLLNADYILISNKVKEECINHRFAIYVEQNFQDIFPGFNDISFDLEYNKNYFDEKEILDDNDERVRFRPDLIIHERMSNRQNLIAFELKKEYPNKKDLRTIQGVLKPPFNYKSSVIICYLPDKKYMKVKIYSINKKGVDCLEYNLNK